MKAIRPFPIENSVLIGVFYYAFGLLVMCGMGASAKALSSDYSVVQIIFFNNLVALSCVLVPLGHIGYRQILSANWKLLVVRGIVASGTVCCYFLALKYITYAEVAAIFAVAPLISSILSGWMLKEIIGLLRWTAIGVGFLGALVIIWPTTLNHNPTLLLPLGAALCYALALIYAKILTRTENNLIIQFYTYSIVAFGTLIFLPLFWMNISQSDLPLFLSMGMCNALGNYFYIKGCRHAPVHVLAPFDYTQLIWASLLGFIFWQEIPSTWTWLGASLIAAAGLYILRRQES